jgi:hypothetical protein
MSQTTLAYIAAIGGLLGAASILVTAFGVVYTRRSANTSQTSADAAKSSADSARESVEHQIKVYEEQNTAKVVRHGGVDFSNSAQFAWLTLRLYNEGPAVAKNLVLTFRKSLANQSDEDLGPEQAPVSSEPFYALEPLREVAMVVQVPRFFGSIDGWTIIDLTFEDGNGQHPIRYFLRVNGQWDSDWIVRTQDDNPQLGGNAE